jgi:Carboxypeptidase regulatory-like domain
MRVSHTLLPRLLAIAAAVALCSTTLVAQQTLGGITGEVTDSSGSVIPNATVTLVDEQTSYTRIAKTNGEGTYVFVNLPIDSYTVTFTANGFDTQRTPHIPVQGNRTATLNVQLKVAAATSETVEVDAAPMMNATDTTNGASADGQLHGACDPVRGRKR